VVEKTAPFAKKEKEKKGGEGETKKEKKNIGQNFAVHVLAVKERAPNQIDASSITCHSHRLPACRVDARPHAS
jgi:ribosomal protein S25